LSGGRRPSNAHKSMRSRSLVWAKRVSSRSLQPALVLNLTHTSSRKVIKAVQIWINTAFLEVPQKALILGIICLTRVCQAYNSRNFQVLCYPLERDRSANGGGRVRPPPGRTGPGGWSKRHIPCRSSGAGSAPGAAAQDSRPGPGGSSNGQPSQPGPSGA